MMSKGNPLQMIVRILLLFIALFTFGAQAQAIKESYAFAVLGEPDARLISTILIM